MADVEGLALVRQSHGTGYLLASAQAGTDNPGGTGNSFVTVYQRQGSNQFVSSFQVVPGSTADGCQMTDGIDAVAADLGPLFPFGVFVCQDHTNTTPGSSGNQNFKYVRLEKVVEVEPPGPSRSVSDASLGEVEGEGEATMTVTLDRAGSMHSTRPSVATAT